jgi:MSHA biogenesis protein MshJ
VGIRRTAIEFRVSGSYPNLVRYLRAIEFALPDLRWRFMQLKGGGLHPELTVQVYMVEI